MEAERVLLRSIINTWKDIKALRQSKFTNTSVKLLIRKCVQQTRQDGYIIITLTVVPNQLAEICSHRENGHCGMWQLQSGSTS